jgi:phosphatidylglycerol lysyltransferase
MQFKAEGYSSLSLGAAPLAPVQCQRALSTNEKALHWLKPCLEGLYGFSSLYTFKQKFRPEWKPLYVFYPEVSNWLRIGVALSLICFNS